MIKAICNIKKTRKNKISDYLSAYLQVIVENLNGQQSEDFRHKEALMHAFGLLNLHIAPDEGFSANAVGMLENFIFPELSSDNGFMRARAAWVYGQFSNFTFTNE